MKKSNARYIKMIFLKTTLTSDITRAFALSSYKQHSSSSLAEQHLSLALAEQHSPLAFTLSSCRTAFTLNIRPQLLQNGIHPQFLQNGKFLLQALPPIVGLTLFGFFWSL